MIPLPPPGNRSVWSSVEIDVGFKNKYASHFALTSAKKHRRFSSLRYRCSSFGGRLTTTTTTKASGSMPTAVAGGGGGPPARQPPRCGPDGKRRQLQQPPYPPPQGCGRWSAPHGPAAGTRVLGRTPLESARAYASILPDEAETEEVWVRRWDVEAGGAVADWATCLRLLERATTAAVVARDGAVLTAASAMRVWGGVSSFRAAN